MTGHRDSALSQALAVAHADLRAEARRPILLAAMTAFSVGSLTMLQLAIAGSGRPTATVGAGASWVVLLLAAIVALGSTIGRDRDQGTWDALLVSSATRPTVAAGKFLGMLSVLIALHLFVLPLAWGILATPRGLSEALWGAAAVLLADIGIAAIAVLVGLIAVNTRARELIGPVLLIPLLMPLLIVGASLGAWSVDASFGADPVRLVAFLGLYDAIFCVALWGAADELATR